MSDEDENAVDLSPIEIVMEEPNFDVAVERAVKVAEDRRVNEVRFDRMDITVKDWYGRSNRYTYVFSVWR